jgi:hypothetical protein
MELMCFLILSLIEDLSNLTAISLSTLTQTSRTLGTGYLEATIIIFKAFYRNPSPNGEKHIYLKE